MGLKGAEKICAILGLELVQTRPPSRAHQEDARDETQTVAPLKKK
jgi:hypothetical protein